MDLLYNLTNLFGAPFCPINPVQSPPPPHKKLFKSILSLYAAVTSSNNFSQNLKKPQKPNLDPL